MRHSSFAVHGYIVLENGSYRVNMGKELGHLQYKLVMDGGKGMLQRF